MTGLWNGANNAISDSAAEDRQDTDCAKSGGIELRHETTFPKPAPDTDILDNTVLEFDFGEKEYKIRMQRDQPPVTEFSAEFIVAIDGKVHHGNFKVKSESAADGSLLYTIIEAEVNESWKVSADSRIKDDWYDAAFSIEFPMFEDEPGLGCLKIVDKKDEVSGEIIFYPDGKINTKGLALTKYQEANA